jgi:succinate-semialdehyde dehydrogenase / glutarate-semialdehyde dehydrogenase
MNVLSSPLLSNLSGYWGGRFQPLPTLLRFAVHDPATGAHLTDLPRMGSEQAHQALASAEAYLRQAPPSLDARGKSLTAIAAALRAHRDTLAAVITLENGKPTAEALAEVDYAALFFDDAATHLPALRPSVLPTRPRGLTWTTYHRPSGVAALITPWNFPLGMLAKKLSGALAAGCPSVVKPAELTPLTCIAFFALLDGLNLAPGAVNLVFGDAPAIGQAMCSHPAVRVLSFTGSTGVGKLLAAQCAPHVKRVSLELGGNAPFLVFADADIPRAVDALMVSKFRSAGQTCVCANRVYVARSIAEPFITALVARVDALQVGEGSVPGVEIGPLIDQSAWDKVDRHVRDAVAQGAVVRSKAASLPAPFYRPTVLTGVTADMACTREETFGPLVAVTVFDDEDSAVAAADDTEYGLAAYVFTSDPSRAERAIARLHFGHVGINTGSGPTPEAPFGGFRQSGVGREGGLEGVLEFIELQTVPSAGF